MAVGCTPARPGVAIPTNARRSFRSPHPAALAGCWGRLLGPASGVMLLWIEAARWAALAAGASGWIVMDQAMLGELAG